MTALEIMDEVQELLRACTDREDYSVLLLVHFEEPESEGGSIEHLLVSRPGADFDRIQAEAVKVLETARSA